MAVPGGRLSLPGVSLQLLTDAVGYSAQTSHQVGVYVNAALGAAWVDLTSVDFLSMGAAGALGPVACDANVDFVEITVWNDSANVVYFIFRPHFVAVGPIPEVPTITAFPVPAGGVATRMCSLVDSGDAVFTISLIASGAGSAVRVLADFAARN